MARPCVARQRISMGALQAKSLIQNRFDRKAGLGNGKRRSSREDFWIHAKSPTHTLTTNPVIRHLPWHSAPRVLSQDFAQTASVIDPQRGPNAGLRLTCTPHAPHCIDNPIPPRRV